MDLADRGKSEKIPARRLSQLSHCRPATPGIEGCRGSIEDSGAARSRSDRTNIPSPPGAALRYRRGVAMVQVESQPRFPGLPRPDGLRIIELETSDPRWEAFVGAHPDGLIYHHPAWVDLLTREYRRPLVCLGCVDSGGRLQGILPLMRTRGLLFAKSAATGRRLSSLPRTPFAGPLSLNDRASEALVTAAIDRARAQRGTGLEVKRAPSAGDWMADGLACAPWRLNYVLELPERADELRFGDSRNHARIKWAINKAARHGVQVREAVTLDDLRAWYALYVRTMQSHAVPQRPYRLFRHAWHLMRPRGLMRLLLAERIDGDGRTILAGSMFLMFGRTVFYAFNGCGAQGRSLRANDVIQWEAIHRACNEGFRRYDLGEVVEAQEGLHDFKGKWGAEAQRLYRYYYPSTVGVESTAQESSGPVGRLVRTAWRHLPWRATAQLGDWLYSFM
jgi:hypothetical protein